MTKSRSSPFARVGGQLYLVASFTLDDTHPSLPRLLKALLQKHPPSDVLILRRLSEPEETEVLRALDDAKVDVWAHMSPDLSD